MNDRELQAAAMGIITYQYLLDADELPDVDVGDILEIGAELDDHVLEATLELLSSMDMDELEMFELPIDGDDA